MVSNMVKKYLKYGTLLQAEIISRLAKKVQESTEDFVRKNTNADYEQTLSDTFDDIEQKIRDFSPQLEMVSNSVNKIKDNILDFQKKKVKF